MKTAGLSGQADRLKQMIHRWQFSAFLPMRPQRTLGRDIWPGLPPGWRQDPGGTDGGETKADLSERTKQRLAWRAKWGEERRRGKVCPPVLFLFAFKSDTSPGYFFPSHSLKQNISRQFKWTINWRIMFLQMELASSAEAFVEVKSSMPEGDWCSQRWLKDTLWGQAAAPPALLATWPWCSGGQRLIAAVGSRRRAFSLGRGPRSSRKVPAH